MSPWGLRQQEPTHSLTKPSQVSKLDPHRSPLKEQANGKKIKITEHMKRFGIQKKKTNWNSQNKCLSMK